MFTTTAVETTSLANTDYAKTFMPGTIDPGTITFEAEYTSENYVALHALVRTVLGWRVSAPTGEGDVVTCDGFLTSISVTHTPEDEIMISGTIQMSGLPELT